MGKYSIGLDYGTLSVRAVLLNLETGQEEAASVYDYPHGIIEDRLPGSHGVLPEDYALQDPADYYNGLVHTVRELMETGPAAAEEVIGIGLDVTAATILPVLADKTPLCQTDAFRNEPHAWIKLWKHHAAEQEAADIDRIARERGESWLSMYGGKISAEWAVPKALETLRKAPAVYEAADRYIETMDWLVWILTDRLSTSACAAGYKSFYHHETGFPSEAFFEALDPRMKDFVRDKLPEQVLPIGGCAGYLTARMAEVLGLQAGTPVAVPIIDAHCAVPGGGVSDPGDLMIIMGTSSCHLLLSEQTAAVPGIQGIVKDGILPGYFGIEAGQSCVGDGFGWFVDNLVPERYVREAQEQGISLHACLTQKLEGYVAGESGLIALDWLNGVRSPLMDFDLSGLILGLTLRTRPEQIYLALIEATAYGTRLIIENFEKAGVPVRRVVLGGGIPVKNPFIVQLYADVLGRPIELSESKQACALGAAILGAAAAPPAVTGYDSAVDAVKALAHRKDTIIQPDPVQNRRYDRLYAEYRQLAESFGQGEDLMMHRLKHLVFPD